VQVANRLLDERLAGQQSRTDALSRGREQGR
jgi:hypothetical protein